MFNVAARMSVPNIELQLQRQLKITRTQIYSHLRSSVAILTTTQMESPELEIVIPKTLRERLYLIATIRSARYPRDLNWIFKMFEDIIRKDIVKYEPVIQVKILSLLEATPSHVLTMILHDDIIGHNPREIFGNLIGLRNSVSIDFFFRPERRPKPRKTQRVRGYRDHGTLVQDNHGRNEFNGSYEQQELISKQAKLQKQIELAAFYQLLEAEDYS